MNRDGFFYLGKILKSSGSKGHLLIYLDVDDPARYRKTETVFIGIGEDRVPFAVSKMEIRHKGQAILLLDGVNDAGHAEIFAGREIYLPLSMLPPLKGKKFYYHEVTGFSVIDKKHGNIGSVSGVLDLPLQALFQVQHGSKEILIPMVDEILVKIDRQKKEIHIEAPDGLIEIYL
jgi:16S rRNA processing protein RimM